MPACAPLWRSACACSGEHCHSAKEVKSELYIQINFDSSQRDGNFDLDVDLLHIQDADQQFIVALDGT